MTNEITNEELARLKALAELVKSGEYSINACNEFVEASGPEQVLALIAKVESLAADAERLSKLLEFCTEAKPSFGPRGELRAMTMKFKNSVETSFSYRNELRKLIDEMQPVVSAKKEKA